MEVRYIYFTVVIGVLVFPVIMMMLLNRRTTKGWDLVEQAMRHECERCGVKMITPPNLIKWRLCSDCWLDDMEHARFLQAREERDGP